MPGNLQEQGKQGVVKIQTSRSIDPSTVPQLPEDEDSSRMQGSAEKDALSKPEGSVMLTSTR